MTVDLAASIVRILRPDGTTSGAGFVVTDSGLIATCSHVVQSPESQNRGEPRPEKVAVVFNSTGDKREARVQPDWWRTATEEDVAILQLEGGLPPGVQPIPLGDSVKTSGHGFKTFGFPDARSEEGLWGYGVIGDLLRVEAGWALLQLTGTTEVSPGFSGAPVLDIVKRRAIGMVTAITAPDQYGRLVETAFITPTETLRSICQAIQLSDICPYLGLSFFTEADAEFFFGRQQVVKRLLESLRHEPRFLAVLGPSGCGKSSVIRARLIPDLRQGAVPGSDKWHIIVVRTSDQPFEQLRAQGFRSPEGMLESAKSFLEANPDKTRLALILDQFEETLVCPDQLCQSFLSQLSGLLESPLQVTLIFVMRDEFYSRFVKQAPSLLPWIERGLVNVPPTIGKEELFAIVLEPARVVGLEFEPGLVEDCVNDVMKLSPGEREQTGQSAALPLLEFALTQLWERRDEGVLTHEAYISIGGVTGCLAQWADRAYSSLDERERKICRCVLTGLVHLGNQSQGIPDSKRQRPLADICGKEKDRETLRKVVDKLTAERLLITSFDSRSGQEIVDLIHDALIREWGLFQQWLKEDRSFLLWSQEAEERALAWIDTGPDDPEKRDEGRLMRGRDLAAAEGWLKERGEDLSREQIEHIQASLSLLAREQAERERLRKRTIKVLVAGLAVAIALSSIAIFQWQQTEMQKRAAFAGELTASSMLIKDEQAKSLPLGIALAVESLRRFPTPDARRVLLSELALLPRSVSNITHEGRVTSVAFSPDGKYVATTSEDKTAMIWQWERDAASGVRSLRLTHYGHVITGSFSPDNRYYATGSDDNTSRLWEVQSGKEIAILNHNGSVSSIAFSPDGRYLATGSDDGTAALWVVPGCQRLVEMGHDDAVWAVAFSPDGKYLATGSRDGTARLWEMPGGREIEVMYHNDSVGAVTFSPDGRYLATGSNDRTARVWEVQSGNEVKRMYHTDAVNDISFSPNSRYIATASSDRYARVWDIESGSEIARLSHEWVVRTVAFSPSGEYIATASLDGTARVMAISSGLEVLRMAHDDSVYDIAFSPDGRYLATASRDETARVWAATDERKVAQVAHAGAVANVLFSPDGRYLATASSDKTAGLWDVPSGRRVAQMVHRGPVNDIRFSPDGKYIATASSDNTTVLWSVPDGKTIARMSHKDKVMAEAFSFNGSYLVTGSLDSTAILWQMPGGQKVAVMNHSGPVYSVAISQDGRYIATGSDDYTAAIWHLPNCTEVMRIDQGGYLNAVAFSPDSRYLATAGQNKTARLWEVPTGRLIAAMPHDDEVTTLAFSPNGSHLVTASVDRTAKLWEIPSGRQVNLMEHGNEVWAVAFSPNGTYVATGSDDKIARIWPATAGTEVALMDQGGHVNSVAFSPDGRYIATGSDDKTASIWLWSAADPAAEACMRLTRNPTCGEWRQYFGSEAYRRTCPNLAGGICDTG